jgi:hypothetical protein
MAVDGPLMIALGFEPWRPQRLARSSLVGLVLHLPFFRVNAVSGYSPKLTMCFSFQFVVCRTMFCLSRKARIAA